MQTMLLMGMFLFVSSLMFGLVGGTALSSMRLIDMQVADTKEYFKKVEKLINEYWLNDAVMIPTQASPVEYLRNTMVRKGANWAWGNADKDPWGNPLFVLTSYQDHPLRADSSTSPAIVVSPKAMVMVLASPGPNGTYGPALQAQLNALSSSSSIETMMRVEADPETDDIVHTFNTRRALEERWNKVEWNMRQLLYIAQYRYTQMYQNASFKSSLESYAAGQYGTYFSGQNLDLINCTLLNTSSQNIQSFYSGGTLTLPTTGQLSGCDALATQTALEIWKKSAAIASAPDVNNLLDVDDAATSEFVRFITATNNANTIMTLQASALKSDAANLVADVMRLSVDKPASAGATWAWKNSAGQFHFHLDSDD
ncbi:MAG: hypothetical protein WAX89_02555 [Alphaproteobacteria bacterium]